jgi:phage terminase small subunit
MDWFDGLTEKQRRFVEVYSSNGGNALDAARVAGYRQPHPQGAENMQKPTVRAAIEALREETTTSATLTRAERQAFWTRVTRGEVMEPDGKPPAIRDRLRASELLARSQADFLDRTEVSTGPSLAEILNERLRRVDGPRAEAGAS